MASPSSQVIAQWTKQALEGSDWILLSDVCAIVIRRHCYGIGETELSDVIERNLSYVAEHLRDEASEWLLDGITPIFEIDNDPKPYIRPIAFAQRDILLKLRRIDPLKFEEVCAKILRNLGAVAHSTQPTNDGGVDFLGFSLKTLPSAFLLPQSATAVVIGQAKRHQEDNLIREKDLREFVGAVTLRRHELQRDGKIGPLTPLVCAYWTTSDFDQGAKRYARTIGLWYMEGRTLAAYVDSLSLRSFVEQLADVPL